MLSQCDEWQASKARSHSKACAALQVDLLMFSLEQPKQVSLWYPGKTAGWYFEHVMAPFVAGATGAAAPIIKKFLQP